MSRHESLAAFAIVAVAAALRLTGLDWDGGHHLHPDERFFTMVATALAAPERWSDYFASATSPLNPRNQGFSFYVYGTLPLFLGRSVAEVLDRADFAQLPLVGRTLAALFDVATVLLTWRIGRQVGGASVGLGAAALVALSVVSIQQAHFFTVDSFAAAFAAAALLATLHVARGGDARAHLAFGLALGAATASRINLAVLAALYPCALAAALLAGRIEWRRALVFGALATTTALAIFRVAQPYAFAGPGFFGLAPDVRFLANLSEVRGMVDGSADIPPAYQWIGRVRPLYALQNLAATGLGPAWAAAALGGAALWLRGRVGGGAPGARILPAFAIVFVLYHASQFVASGRYFLPAVPVMAVAAALLLRAPSRWQRAVFPVALAGTLVWALAFHGIYRDEHSRVAASRWMVETLPPGATLTHEHWDDGLPLSVPGAAGRFETVELALYHRADEAKRAELQAALDRADYIVLSSDRLFGSIPRVPWQYPLARRYYELLFGGALGFEPLRSFVPQPRLGPLAFDDRRSEEAFRVYDHPEVHAFGKRDDYDPARVRTLLGAVRLDTASPARPAEASARYRAALPTAVLPPATGTATARAAPSPILVGGPMGSAEGLVRWLGLWALLAAAAVPLARRLLPEHPDVAGVLILLLPWVLPGHGAWSLASWGLAPFSGAAAPALAGALTALGAAIAWRDRRVLAGWLWNSGVRASAPLVAFALVFATFAALRALNPTLYWGEKPMDLAILGTLARSRALPPPDPWFAGETLNYFHLGHAWVVAFARTAGVPLGLAWNLALATGAGLVGAAAYATGRALGGTWRAGALAVFLTLFAGNLAAPRVWWADPGTPIDFDFFWATSRVVAHTINEFPFWSYLFGDLHAHVLALPLEVAAVALATTWLGGKSGAGARVVCTGFLLGAIAATSTWSVPLAAGVQAAFLATAVRAGAITWRGGVARLGAIAAIAFAVTAPFWLDYTPAAVVGIMFERVARVAPADLATLFGVFALAALPALAVCTRDRTRGTRVGVLLVPAGAALLALALRSGGAAWAAGFATLALVAWGLATPGARAGVALIGLAAAAVLAAEVLVLSDRMNTLFKLHLSAWPLAAMGVAALLPGTLAALSRPTQRVLATALGVAFVAAASTSVAAAYGLLHFPRVASPLTLDGTRYLQETAPAELAAYRWLNRNVAGSPVILEATDAPYRASTRVAMHTGLPTPVGWEHHLVQQARGRSEVRVRTAGVDRFFTTPDRAEAGALLDWFRADFVFVGGLERRRYPGAGLAKFADWNRLEPVFREGDVAIYATPGAGFAHKTWVDPLPADTAPATAPPLGVYREPRGLALAADGTLFVADFGHGRIQRLRFGRPDLAFGRPGEEAGPLHDPCGVAVAPDGRVFVSDTWNHRIEIFAPNGQRLGGFTSGFYGPRGVAIGSDGHVYVADTGNARVVRFTADGEPSGGLDDGPAWREPIGIAARDGEIFVFDQGPSEVRVYAESGALLRRFPVDVGREPASEPHLDVGRDGTVWVTDPVGARVLLYDRTGTPLGVAEAARPLTRPMGIAVLDSHNAMVTSGDTLVVVRRPQEQRAGPP